MSVAVAPEQAMAREAGVRLDSVGVRFDFDRLGRVVTPILGHLRRIRSSAWGLRDVDLRIEPGTGLALVGPTGSGKTTLLRVLAGIVLPDEGRLEVRARVGSLLATNAGLQMLLTGRENAELLMVLAGLRLEEARAVMDLVEERARVGAAFDHPVYTYSEGMRARLGVAAIQASSADLLLLDEVFEALDHEFRAIVEDYAHELRRRGGMVVAAGHDHVALERFCPRAVLLERGRVRIEGPYREVIETYRGSAPGQAGAGVST